MPSRKREWKPKETDEYWTLLDLALREDIYLINYYGFVYEVSCTFADHLRDRLQHVGQNAIGIMFGGCLVVLPADVALKNLGYLRPTRIPRRAVLVTKWGRMCTIYGRICKGCTAVNGQK